MIALVSQTPCSARMLFFLVSLRGLDYRLVDTICPGVFLFVWSLGVHEAFHPGR
jgi:hypothetical protein